VAIQQVTTQLQELVKILVTNSATVYRVIFIMRFKSSPGSKVLPAFAAMKHVPPQVCTFVHLFQVPRYVSHAFLAQGTNGYQTCRQKMKDFHVKI
jgi:hypothetical protein